MSPIPKTTNTNWVTWFINLFLLSLLLIIHTRLHQYAFDDAYIHLRVARNFFETGSPYFNAGDALKVSTSSGWIVFLTTLFWLAKLIQVENNFPLIVSVTNAVILMVGMLVYSKIVGILLEKSLTISQKLLFQIIFLALLLPSSIGLMETPLALLIAGLGLYFLLLAKPEGFALLGFAAYIRLELLFLVALAFIIVTVKKQFRFHKIIVFCILGFIPLICYDLYFYHTVVPHSIIAKSKVYSLSQLDTIAKISLQSLPAIPNFDDQTITIIRALFIVIFIITSWVTFRERAILNHPWLLLFYFSGLSVVSFYIFSHVLLFEWYIPLYAVWILISCFTYSFLLEYPRKIIMGALLLLWFSFSIISIVTMFYASFYNRSKFSLFESGSRVKLYLKVGEILNEEYPNAKLLTSEIGGLGYTFKGEILDAAGLASPNALEFHPLKSPEQRASVDIGAIPPEYVRLTMPDIIVSYDTFAQALLDDVIVNQYHVITVPAYLPDDAVFSKSEMIWGNKYLRVYIHHSLPVSKKICALAEISNETPNVACTGQMKSTLLPH